MDQRNNRGWKRMPLGLWVMIAAGIGRILLSVVELVFARLTHRPRT